MNHDIILYILVAMIAYDLSIHVIYLFRKESFFLERNIHYWPEWSGRPYQVFWAIYWGFALVLLTGYLIGGPIY